MTDENQNPTGTPQNSGQEPSGLSAEGGLPSVTLEGQIDLLTAERDRLQAEKADLEDRLLRRQAEFENYRRRAERDRSDFIQFAAMDVARELLPVLDDFERALKTDTPDKNYATGVELIYQRLLNTLKKVGVEPIEAVGKVFDPNHHEAVQRVPADEGEDQIVLEEFQRGYNFKGKLLRPAMVKVAVKS